MRNSMTQQRRFTKEFEEEAVRLARTSGRTQREIAGDLGIGLSTLDRPEPGSARYRSIGGSERCHGGAEATAAGERDSSAGARHPEEGHRFFRPGGKSMRFALIDRAKAEFPVHRLCRVLGLAKAAISPGEVGQLVAANVTTWCCWHMSGQPLPCRTAPMAVPVWHGNCGIMALRWAAAGSPG